ncbi:hypothetical protein BCV70DRAFT_207629 [Testicularia cyperi]|uniref:Stress response protein NST1 n=1 Tax=Testicularia cyperi TaxID=1882483 RepID=A0A317XLG4_9BASI|nr:hypothetical protein BCV70DRAFT_207629 [Testicularia cyperi]
MAKSKLPRSTPAARTPQAPPPKLAAAAAAAAAVAAQQQQQQQAAQTQQNKASLPGASTPPRSASPSSLHDTDATALASSAKKKKKKSKAKAKDSDFVDEHEYDLQAAGLGHRPRSPASLAARAQAQTQLLAAASELYRRIEGDPQGIPDDDAYWTSLPAHLRAFIRNALPLGQFPPGAQAALDGNPNDPNNRHASTQAMIAVAQQLAQAAHASQRHMQQYPTGNHSYPPLPFDPSIFADLALHPDQPLPLHPHPNAGANGTHAQYASSPNPPPTQPPVEPLPPPVVLYNNLDDDADRYDDRDDGEEYYSEDDLDADGPILDRQGNLLRARNGVWVADDGEDVHGPNGLLDDADPALPAAKGNKKKKKKKKAGTGINAAGDNDGHYLEPEDVPMPPKPAQNTVPAPSSVPPVSRGSNPPPPSSRAAGKQPMTFNSNGKTPARPANGVPAPSNSGKRSVSSSTHGNAQTNPTNAVASSNARIWSTSSAEERERIKEFWLGLSVRDRQKLVQVEKETVLKKMKEQQRHLCSCAVCGRKRSAIEDELEVLYDAYYDELEDYANHQQRWASSGGTIPPPPGPGPFPGSVALDASGAVIGGDPLSRARAQGRDSRHTHGHHHHGQQRKAPLHPESSDGYDDEELDDDADYDDEEDDAEYDDEEEDDDIDLDRDRTKGDYPKRGPIAPNRRRGTGADDLFGLGSSLTVKGGILTVADDMLKNDGRKFLEMMEQLAERRMHREEITAADLASEDIDDDHPDDVDDEDDLDEEDEDDEDDEILTDEQRMEEGRKMFQIFAARMFEQRVLHAYRERVAAERQLQLLRELEEEDENEKAREEKRQKESQKKKDKKRAQKEAKEAERKAKEEEKAVAEAEARALAQAQREAEIKKQEEIRRQREAERKAKEEEKAKKEELKRRRQAEERERELERERKKREKEEKLRLEREAQEKAKREKAEEARRAKEEQERIQREKAEAERKAKEEADRKAEASKREKEAKAQAQREAKLAASAATTAAARGSNSSSRSPSVSAPQTPARSARASATSVPSSPAVVQSAARPAGTVGRGLPAQKPVVAASATPSAAASIASTLPAPPQGLPPRPTTSVLTPSSAISQGSSVSVAANAGLPRPPVNAGSASAAPSLGFGSIGPGSSSTIQSGSAPAKPSSSASASPQPAQPSLLDKSAFSAPITASQSMAAPQLGSMSGSRMTSSFAQLQPGLEGLRSPTLPNGLPSSMPIGSKAAMETGLQSPSLSMAPGVGGMTSNLASLNLGTGGQATHGLGGAMQSPVQTPFSPMSATGNDHPMRSRTTSMVDVDPMAAFAGMRPNSSLSQRPSFRPSQPAPIGPIGRPKAVESLHHDELAGAIGNGRSSSNASGSGATSPRLPEGILGSSALGGDDDIIDPKPRRTSNTIPIGGNASGGNVFFGGLGGGVGAVGGGFGISSASSPWHSYSNAGSQQGPGPLSPGFNAAPGQGPVGGSMTPGSFGMGGTPGSGTMGQSQPDPWSRAQTSWDRARFAFEQPGGNGLGGGGSNGGLGTPGSLGGMGGGLHGAPGHHQGLGGQHGAGLHQLGGGGASGGNAMNPFGLGAPGSGARTLFGAPGGGHGMPGAIGAIGSALSPTSPGPRHAGHGGMHE